MLGGGLLTAGISQAQEAGAQAERGAELVAASGGPVSAQHLIAFSSGTAAVEVRDADVGGSTAEAASSAEATKSPTAPPPASSPKAVAAEIAPVR